MKYIVATNEFDTLKEAVEYQNTLQIINRDNMVKIMNGLSTLIDTTITRKENE